MVQLGIDKVVVFKGICQCDRYKTFSNFAAVNYHFSQNGGGAYASETCFLLDTKLVY